jgi:hypothetical protein
VPDDRSINGVKGLLEAMDYGLFSGADVDPWIWNAPSWRIGAPFCSRSIFLSEVLVLPDDAFRPACFALREQGGLRTNLTFDVSLHARLVCRHDPTFRRTSAMQHKFTLYGTALRDDVLENVSARSRAPLSATTGSLVG